MMENTNSSATLLGNLTFPTYRGEPLELPEELQSHQFRVNSNVANCYMEAPLNPSPPQSTPILLCGHSRGGAIADLAMLHLGEVYRSYENLGIITFGQVFTFSAPLANYLDTQLPRSHTIKFCGSGDIGPWLRRSGYHSYAPTEGESQKLMDAQIEHTSGQMVFFAHAGVPQYKLSGKHELISRDVSGTKKLSNASNNHAISKYIAEMKSRAENGKRVEESEEAEEEESEEA